MKPIRNDIIKELLIIITFIIIIDNSLVLFNLRFS